MDVKAINSLSFVNFEGKTKKQAKKQQTHNYPQQTDPASRKSAQALRNMMYGLMLLAVISCQKLLYEKLIDLKKV